eukprot:gnl/TRDRNA2_/TRDRNA2_200195_c0_seq1.p1 gnl/TRDRNA2_/TRDRNA2_200195_c0~~gnl/TRDRNA2_/TRDRNA2_200195_c0_seq1.p1  ORF type:complete len:321 (+),score=60.19 gnl/TRDRNA2_/TRDRNA2_200195_c0_seq1:72-1034(+)
MAKLQSSDASEFITGEWGPPQAVAYNGRDVLLYAVGIGCDEMKWIYEQDASFEVFPTYPVVLSQKGQAQSWDTFASSDGYLGKNRPKPSASVQPKPPAKTFVLKGVKVMVDAERYIEKVKPLPTTGAKLEIRSRLYGVHKRGSGALIERESELYDPATDMVYYKFIEAQFHIGAHSFTEAGNTYSKTVSPPARAPDAVEEMHVSAQQAHLYRLSGDYNPLHIDPLYPGIKGGGFRGPILHGLCTLGHATRAVMKGFGDNSAGNFKSVKVRFSSPVLPGETLVTKMWREGNRVIFTTEVKETGKICVSNAYFEMSSGASKL